MAYPRRQAGNPGWPLLATLGVHLLLAWGWHHAHSPPLQPSLGGERVFDLILVPPPSFEAAAPRRDPPRSPDTRPTSPTVPTVPTAPAGGAVPAPEPATAASEAPASVSNPFANAAPSVPAQSTLEAMLGRARRDAAIIDREMRKGKSGVPEAVFTPQARLREALEAAHDDGGLGLTSDTYTAPDGQLIYRFNQGGRVRCRTGGSVRPQIGGAVGGGATLFDGAGGEGAAGQIRCPSHGHWKRD